VAVEHIGHIGGNDHRFVLFGTGIDNLQSKNQSFLESSGIHYADNRADLWICKARIKCIYGDFLLTRDRVQGIDTGEVHQYLFWVNGAFSGLDVDSDPGEISDFLVEAGELIKQQAFA